MISEYAQALEDTKTPSTTAKRWQKIAEVPEGTIEKYVAQTNANGAEVNRIKSLVAHLEFHRDGSRPIALRIYEVTDPRFPLELWHSYHYHPISFGSKQKAVARWREECRRLADEGWRLTIDQIADDDFMIL